MAASEIGNDTLSSIDWIETVIENLERKDNEGPIRQILENHLKEMLGAVGMERQAYAWLKGVLIGRYHA